LEQIRLVLPILLRWWILSEHPSYNFSIREDLYLDFIKSIGTVNTKIIEGILTIKRVEEDLDEELEEVDVESLIKEASKLSRTNELIFFIKEKGKYIIPVKIETIKDYFKLVKDYYGFRRLEDLFNILLKGGFKKEKPRKIAKKELIVKDNDIEIEESGERVGVLQIVVPHYIVEMLDNKLIYEPERKEEKLKFESKGKQTKLIDYFNELLKMKEIVKEIDTAENFEEILEEVVKDASSELSKDAMVNVILKKVA